MFAETLAGIALVKSAVDGIKSAIGTAKDISEFADDIDKLFTGAQQIQRKRIKEQNDPFSVGSVARETIDDKLAQEQVYKVSQLVDFRFGNGTWQGIINEQAIRLQDQKEAEKQHRLAREKQQEEMMIAGAFDLGLIAALGVFAFLCLKFS